MLQARAVARSFDLWQVGKGLIVALGNAQPSLVESVAFLQLLNPQGRGNVRHVIFVPRPEDFVIPGALLGIAVPCIMANPVKAHHPHPTGPLRIVRRSHPALSGRDGLGCVKRETSNIPDGSDFPTAMAGG